MVAEVFGMDGIIVIVVVAVVLFGGTQIPKLARSLGTARREFARGQNETAEASDVQVLNGAAERHHSDTRT